MTLRQPVLSPTELMTKFASGPVASGKAATGNPRFAQVWAEVMPASHSQVEVRRGDTLIGLVKAHYRQQGLPVSETQAYRLAHQVAADNHIANPDLIEPGQKVDFARLNLPTLARDAPPALPSAWSLPAAQQLSIKALSAPAPTGSNPPATGEVLGRVLDRAVEKGYLDGSQIGAVRARIGELAQRYNFEPDDFARLSLMESDGLNPKATNGRCHGILQFCEGPGRGAASVGMQGRAADIQQQPVLAQLDLVDRYFEDTRLGEKGPVSLVDLYLTVLTPAARVEQRPNAALGIAGQQAKALHVSGDRSQPITRQSILSGLISHAQQRLDALIHPKRTAELQVSRGDPTARADMASTLDGLPSAGVAGAKRELEVRDRIGRQG